MNEDSNLLAPLDADTSRLVREPLDPRQKRIVERLTLIGPGPAAFFADACAVMNGEAPLATTTHTVAHYLREIDSAVRSVLMPMVDEARRQEIRGDETHRREIVAIVASVGFDDPDVVAGRWWAFASRLANLAHRDALASPRRPDDEFGRLWAEAQEVYDVVTERFVSSFLRTTSLIDTLAAKTDPTDRDVAALRNQLPQSVAALNRFFDQANGSWLPVLRANSDYLSSPSGLAIDADGLASFTQWPPGRLLIRMASVPDAQEHIIEVALALDTDNPDAHERLTEAALELPPPQAARLVDKVGEWLRTPFQWVLPLKATELAIQLANNGEVAAGLRLFRYVLESPRATGDQWLRVSTLEESASAFFPAAGEGGIALLAETLEQSISESQRGLADASQDYSYIWRPDLERNRTYGGRDAAVTALRSALATMSEADPDQVSGLVTSLEARPFAIFQRLALDLLTAHPDGNEALIAERLLDQDLFRDPHLYREYTALATKHFSTLPLREQQTVLAWIEAGDGLEDREQRERWQLGELLRLGSPLPADWEERRGALRAQYGESQVVILESGWVGARTPYAPSELNEMTVSEVLTLLRDWEPDPGSFTATREGLFRALSEAISIEPARYAAVATSFATLDAHGALAAIEGFDQASRAGRAFAWPPVLDLANSISNALDEAWSDDEPISEQVGEVTRRQTALLLLAALEVDPPLPLEHGDQVFATLRNLAEHPHVGAEADDADIGGALGTGVSLLTARGAAFRALMHFASWDARERERAGLESLGLPAELAALLERHLHPGLETSLAVRATYGQWFPALITLDEGWARAHAPSIFPDSPELTPYLDAAWNGYIGFNRAYATVFDLLRHVYAATVEALDHETNDEGRAEPGNRDERLAEHLVTMFWHGHLALDDALLDRFFTLAPLRIRAHVIEFAGLSLANGTTPISADTESRLRALWDCRLAAFKRGEADAAELEGFAWWFSSGQLDDDWSLAQLHELLSSDGRVDPGRAVAERLAVLVQTRPAIVARCLALLIESSEQRWFVTGSSEPIRTILVEALAKGGVAGDTATEIINRLAAVGHTGFTDLLQQHEIPDAADAGEPGPGGEGERDQ